jgi:hypothetical protein
MSSQLDNCIDIPFVRRQSAPTLPKWYKDIGEVRILNAKRMCVEIASSFVAVLKLPITIHVS